FRAGAGRRGVAPSIDEQPLVRHGRASSRPSTSFSFEGRRGCPAQRPGMTNFNSLLNQRRPPMTKVLVLYYSAYGHIEAMANAVAEGAREAGVSVDIKRVPELVPPEVAKASYYK